MTHHHGIEPPEGPPRPRLAWSLTAAVLAVTLAALAAVALLWPNQSEVPKGADPYGQVDLVDATVTKVTPFDCGSTGTGPDNVPMVEGMCAQVTAETDDGRSASFTLDPTRYVGGGMSEGDEIRVSAFTADGQETTYEFYDYQRGPQLAIIALVFAVLVTLVGRWRGLFALIGIGITLLVLLRFVLPALLADQPPIAVAVAGSTVIMLAVLYLAHGVSIRTTAALFGTLFGIAFTAIVGAASTDWAHLTGVGSEDDHLLLATAPQMSLSGVVAASMVIAGLGVLNDVTVTQASAVWEMRALKPTAARPELFVSAMRIGRDHIASSVYTLVFAYAGTAMTTLLLISAYQRPLLEVAVTEGIAQEVIRTLVGAIGLVLAVPITTAIAVWLAPARTGTRASAVEA
ncbi:YibE/F family protein [Aeromicrobium senzhongii]|uniref:YibE/F family protein n=1 Tax=Aeromicrobium senzhongii TaxID=2663859 RepID=A0ABX6SV06_9ACTN|nr:YibE/F family protein [Aeromicrobium senzhongii]MTB87873.1 YibE/F family protein [Aeromicrobium senzhongii]QNL95107.1 YibE/F family protein [Aeromicrobium senzhongii]